MGAPGPAIAGTRTQGDPNVSNQKTPNPPKVRIDGHPLPPPNSIFFVSVWKGGGGRGFERGPVTHSSQTSWVLLFFFWLNAFQPFTGGRGVSRVPV